MTCCGFMTSHDREVLHEYAPGFQQKFPYGIHMNPHVPFFGLMTGSHIHAG